jgi:hypothetical protein
VHLLGQAELENGSISVLPSLLVVPGNTAVTVQGLYPEYQVQAGDHFRAVVGCENGAAACSVLFSLAYLDENAQEGQLWSIGEFQDGQAYTLDLSLDALQGKTIRLILGVSPLGSSSGDRALWVNPRIVRMPSASLTPSSVSTSTLPPASSTAVPSSTAPAITSPVPPAVSTPPPAVDQGPAAYLRQLVDQIVSFLKDLFGR